MRHLIPSAFLALLLFAGVQQVQAQDNADLNGTWEISWETARGATTTTFTFEQDGDAFTGVAQMMMGGRPGGGGGGGAREVEITDGAIDGDTFTFSMAMGMGERSMTFTFNGTVTDDGQMEGTMTTARGENPFTGKRKEG
jgi:hypothetical protein